MLKGAFFILVILFFTACKEPAKKSVDIESDGLHIAFNKSGNGDTTLLFLHGWCINRTYWQEQEKYFSPRYTVVTMDLPGFGESGKNRDEWTIEQYGRDVIHVIQSLNLKNVILVGHSMSGDVMLESAVADSARMIGLIGIDNLKDVKEEIPDEITEGYAMIIDTMKKDYKNIAEQICLQTLFHPTTDTGVINRVIADVKNADSVVSIKCLASLAAYSSREAAMLKQLPYKLYLLNSDATDTDEGALRQFCRRGFEIVPIHATGHYPMLEKPAEFNSLLQSIIYKMKE